jgi:hypothetical protein
MTVTAPAASPDIGAARPISTTVARFAGIVGLAQVVIMFAAVTQEVMDAHTTSPATLLHDFGTANLTQVFAGGYLEALSFVVLMPALVAIGWLFTRGSEATRLAAQTFLAFGIAWIAATLAVGFAPGAAAIYAAHHGADATTVATVNDIRNFAYYLQVVLQGGMAVALGTAAVLGRLWPRVVGWGGVVVGAAMLVATPFAQNALAMLWLLWWIALSVLLIKGPAVVD